MNVHLSNILSSYLEVIANNMNGTMEVIFREDALSRIDDHNALVARYLEDVERSYGGCI